MSEKATFLSAAVDMLKEHALPHLKNFVDEDVISQKEFAQEVVTTMAELAWLDFRGVDVEFDKDLLKKALVVKGREVLQGARLAAFDAAQETLWSIASIAGKFAKLAVKSALS